MYLIYKVNEMGTGRGGTGKGINEMNALVRVNHGDLGVILLLCANESILYYVGAFVWFLIAGSCFSIGFHDVSSTSGSTVLGEVQCKEFQS